MKRWTRGSKLFALMVSEAGTKVLSVVRIAAIASVFGVTEAYGMYVLYGLVCGFVFGGLYAVVGTVIVPQVASVADNAEFWGVINRIGLWCLWAGAALGIIAVGACWMLTAPSARGDVGVELLVIALSTFVASLASLLNAALLARGNVTVTAFGKVASNIGAICGTALSHGHILWLAVGGLSGSGLLLGASAWACVREGWMPILRECDMRAFGQKALTGGLAAQMQQITSVVDGTVARWDGGLVLGEISYVVSLVSMIRGLVDSTITAVLYPVWSKIVGDKRRLQDELTGVLDRFRPVWSFGALLVAVMRRTIVSVLLEHGRMGPSASSELSRLLVIGAILLPLAIECGLLYRVAYLTMQGRTIAKITAAFIGIEAALCVAGGHLFGAAGILGANVVAYAVYLIMVTIKMRAVGVSMAPSGRSNALVLGNVGLWGAWFAGMRILPATVWLDAAGASLIAGQGLMVVANLLRSGGTDGRLRIG